VAQQSAIKINLIFLNLVKPEAGAENEPLLNTLPKLASLVLTWPPWSIQNKWD